MTDVAASPTPSASPALTASHPTAPPVDGQIATNIGPDSSTPGAPAPATLPRRMAAFAIDYVALSIWIILISIVFALLPRVLVEPLFATPLSSQLTGFAVLKGPVLLYFALQEASARQGTIGKRILGLRVTDGAGRRIILPRSLGRSAVKLLPWELAHTALWRIEGWPTNPEPMTGLPLVLTIACWTLIAGFVASALLTRSRRTPYDLAAGTMVVRDASAGPG